jgi:hypothetical protein
LVGVSLGCGSTDATDLREPPPPCRQTDSCGDAGTGGTSDAGSGGAPPLSDGSDSSEQPPADANADVPTDAGQPIECLPGFYQGPLQATDPSGQYRLSGGIQFELLAPDEKRFLALRDGSMSRVFQASVYWVDYLEGGLDCAASPPVFTGRVVGGTPASAPRPAGHLSGTVDPSNNAVIFGPYEVDMADMGVSYDYTFQGSWRAELSP